jgi:hypothetical protein
MPKPLADTFFIIAGAPKCGTTALAGYLDEHPEVVMARIKEPRFFTRAPAALGKDGVGDGLLYGGTYERGWDWYESLFEPKPGGKLYGEATTHYFIAPDAPALIRQDVPGVKLVFLLRHPVDRLYSHYWQDYKVGVPLPSFEELVTTNHPRLEHYKNASRYKTHLTRFSEQFPSEHILVLLDQNLKADAPGTFAKVTNFLGVDSSFVPSSIGKKYNEHSVPKVRLLETAIIRLRKSNLAQRLPEGMRRKLAGVRKIVSKANSTAAQYPALPPQLRKAFVDEFADDVSYVEKMLGRSLSEWYR